MSTLATRGWSSSRPSGRERGPRWHRGRPRSTGAKEAKADLLASEPCGLPDRAGGPLLEPDEPPCGTDRGWERWRSYPMTLGNAGVPNGVR